MKNLINSPLYITYFLVILVLALIMMVVGASNEAADKRELYNNRCKIALGEQFSYLPATQYQRAICADFDGNVIYFDLLNTK